MRADYSSILTLPPAQGSQAPRVMVEVSYTRFKRRGKAVDHWHRTENDPGRPYEFRDAETLIDDFFDEVERVLIDRGVALRIIGEEVSKRSK